MPNIKSAKKRLKQNDVRRVRNSVYRTRVRTTSRSFREALAGEDAEAQTQTYAAFCSALDKAVKHNVLKTNNASRRKTRAANRMRDLQAGVTAEA